MPEGTSAVVVEIGAAVPATAAVEDRSVAQVVRSQAARLLPGARVAAAQNLRGGRASLDRQNAQARAHDFTYLRTPEQVAQFVEAGYLVPVVANADFDVHNVSFPYARPEVRLFIERLASQYRAACGEKLVVTSLTRPRSNQPANASSRSVHPTGMAMDLRRPGNAQCQQWLERTLLSLEGQGLLEAIYERNPPHYHVAVYPNPYIAHVEQQTGQTRLAERIREEGPQIELQWVTHEVRRGETLTAIASRYGAAMSRISAENNIRGAQIHVGQRLRIPQYRVIQGPVTRMADAPTSEAQTGEGGSAQASSAQAGSAQAGGGQTGSAQAGSGQARADGAGTAGSASSASAQAQAEEDAVAEPANGEAGPADSGTSTTVHTVRRGESLWAIARAYGVTEQALRSANGLAGSRIVVGQELAVPGVAGAAGPTARHTVRRGESLWTIARQHGTTVDALRQANGIVGGPLHPGQVLEVPTGR
ncbi:MAG: LysM peptidoglycan-binding domain-containing protein [Gemmatimonadales bacterium]|nr:MAG: LysM peptidoglycan-binding domain-containing protein [Gemmatimonadales bacterium]